MFKILGYGKELLSPVHVRLIFFLETLIRNSWNTLFSQFFMSNIFPNLKILTSLAKFRAIKCYKTAVSPAKFELGRSWQIIFPKMFSLLFDLINLLYRN